MWACMRNVEVKSAGKNTLQHYSGPPDQFITHTHRQTDTHTTHAHTAESLHEAAPAGHGTAVLDTTS